MKIALSFLTYKNPLHEDVWKQYINNDNFNILMHPKYPDAINAMWMHFLSSKIVSTNQGSDYIIIATLILLKQSLDLYNSDWYIFYKYACW